ncbi:hypothetical protein ACFQ88_22490 [Paenibacillus sp. NPDC056579]|uniref:hypothetical protein n=1 Tax=Paenibacillus sp. NPDC056579 TaxID=3345871 RepID=UPI0036AB6748
MKSGLFRELFKNNEIKPYSIGDSFPFISSNNSQKLQLAIIASLTCSTCIELLNNISELNKYTFPIYLFLAGTDQEVSGFEKQSSLHIEKTTPISDNMISTDFRAKGTPFIYILDRELKVLDSGIVDEIKDIDEILLKHLHA